MLPLVILLTLIGHTVLWVALINRIHAFAWPRMLIDASTCVCVVLLVAAPVCIATVLYLHGASTIPSARQWPGTLMWVYVGGCVGICIAAGFRKLLWRFAPDAPSPLRSNHTTRIELSTSVAEPMTRTGWPTWLARLPGNEVLTPHIHEKDIVLPALAGRDERLVVAHLSDLHMCGRITKRYFQEIVEIVNRREPDLIALTGDIIEENECISWIADTLGRLHAPGGVYFVLGNHDLHADHERVRRELAEAGLIDLGGRWMKRELRGLPTLLAGNELPWFRPAADLTNSPARDQAGLPLRLLLAHSPDQFVWAQERDIDLVLAGHLHGGQIRLPLLGAIVAPSRFGTRYASSVFRAGSSVMHVSRGTASLTPLRWGCPPEVAFLTLRGDRR